MRLMGRRASGEPRHISALGLNLRRLRTQLGLRQEDLAERSGVSRQTIIDLETGAREGAHFSTVEALARALGVKAVDLLGEQIQAVPVDAMLEAFRASPYAQILQPPFGADDEKWLRSLPALVLFDLQATPESIYHLILGWRARKKA